MDPKSGSRMLENSRLDIDMRVRPSAGSKLPKATDDGLLAGSYQIGCVSIFRSQV